LLNYKFISGHTSKEEMTRTRRQGRNSSSDSSGRGSSSEDDAPSTILGRLAMNKPVELSLKDDEDTIPFQAPLPEDEGEEDNTNISFYLNCMFL
jgi:hypothetical protein